MTTATPAAFLAMGIGSSEILLLLAVFLILLGPRELPRIARTLGKISSHLRKASDEFRTQVMNLDRQEPPRGLDGPDTIPDTQSPDTPATPKDDRHEPAG